MKAPSEFIGGANRPIIKWNQGGCHAGNSRFVAELAISYFNQGNESIGCKPDKVEGKNLIYIKFLTFAAAVQSG